MFAEGFRPESRKLREKSLDLKIPNTENPAEAIVDIYNQLREKGYDRAQAKTMISGTLEKSFSSGVSADEVDRVLTAYAAGASVEKLGEETERRKEKAA